MQKASAHDFHNRLLKVAQALTQIYDKAAVDLEALWRAYLYLAKEGASAAVQALDDFRIGWDWRAAAPAHLPSTAERELPLDISSKRLLGLSVAITP